MEDGEGTNKQFSGKIKDETNLNYFEARYLDGNKGRFNEADPLVVYMPSSLIFDPQSLNGYVYTRNNPIRLIDPDGRTAVEFFKSATKTAVKGAVEFIESIATFNPVESYNSLNGFFAQSGYDAAVLYKKFTQNPEGTKAELIAAFSQIYKDFKSLSDEDKGAIVGYAFEKSAEMYFGIKATSKMFGGPVGATLTDTQVNKIVNHSFGKHVLRQGEFKGIASTPDELASHLKNVVKKPTNVRSLRNNATGYYDANTNTIVIVDPNAVSNGTIYQPNPLKHGKSSNLEHFNSLN